MSVWLVIMDLIDSTESGSVILIEMVLPRRIFILVSGARNRWNRSKIYIYIHYDSYLIFTPRDRIPKRFPKSSKSKDFSFLFNPPPPLFYFDPSKKLSLDFESLYLSFNKWWSNGSYSGNLWISFEVLLNHRGASMNLGFPSIHRVLTREFLSLIKKTRVKLH